MIKLKLKTKFFRTFLIFNILLLFSLFTFFFITFFLRGLSVEKENLDLFARRFANCGFMGAIKNYQTVISPILDGNDVHLIFVKNRLLQGFVYAKLGEYIDSVLVKFPFVKALAIEKKGEIVYFKGHFNINERISINDGRLYLVYKSSSVGVNLYSLLDFTGIFSSFVKKERYEGQSFAIFYNGTYYLYSNGNIKKVKDLKDFAKSSEEKVFDFVFYVVKPKSKLYEPLRKTIVLMFGFLLIFILISSFVSRYLADKITYSIRKVSENLENFRRKEFKKIDINDDFEDEIKVFIKKYNQITEDLERYVENTERIIEEKTKEIKKKNSKLRELSIRDELTGLYNRRFFNEVFPEDYNFALRENMYLNFAIMDLDDFKKINDTYGHQAGDECLRVFSSVLRKHFHRKSDKLFRYGGEEFVVYYISKEKTDFLSLLEKFRMDLENTHILYEENTLLITVSIGAVSELPKNTKYQNIISEADENLYMAKRLGKNRVYFKKCT
ncbi:diguanylate cyclase [Thermosipho sp. 1063]|nr:diguanylate cyclase [Thermosipho sp. 1063]